MEPYAIPSLLEKRAHISILAALLEGRQTEARLLSLTGLAPDQLADGIAALRQGGYLCRAVGRFVRPGRFYELTPEGNRVFLDYIQLLERLSREEPLDSRALWGPKN